MNIFTWGYLEILFNWANVFISFFVIVFAYIFFKKTEPHRNRAPWFYLLVAVMIFFIFELSGVLFKLESPAKEVRDFFRTLFIALILYVFVFQYYLIKKSDAIVIKRREAINQRKESLITLGQDKVTGSVSQSVKAGTVASKKPKK